jgi:recombinational DNA repair protein (RecF pathway)
MVRQQAIILKRRPAAADSLYVDVLLQGGDMLTLRIPGILKSTKRSSFHYAPGAIYDLSLPSTMISPVIPRSMDLSFSPFDESQDYARLAAVAEILQLTHKLEGGKDGEAFFALVARALRNLPHKAAAISAHLDNYYWAYLDAMGLAAEYAGEMEFAAYDLNSGFLTPSEFSQRPHSEFILPIAWVRRAHGSDAGDCDSVACRAAVRAYLGQA